MSEKIAVIGSGYVGLVTACCMAQIGNKVKVFDVDKTKIAQLQNVKLPFYEPELSKILHDNINKNLIFLSDIKETLQNVTTCFIAVGTPHDKVTNAPDLSFFYNAIDQIIKHLSNDILIVNKSTLPLGTAKKIISYIQQKKIKYKVSIATNPEFLSQGRAVDDFMNPQRIVLGVENEKDYKLLKNIYNYFLSKNTPLIKTNIATAELIKYSANAFLAMKVAFINEVAEIASNIGANIEDISHTIGLDNRIGNKFLKPGPGYGGSCFPKDSKALSFASKSLNLNLPLIQNIDFSNEITITAITNKIVRIIKQKEITEVAMLGLAFKAGTDDVRDSQAIKIINSILHKLPNIKIYIHDPIALDNAKRVLDNNNIIVIENLDNILTKLPLFCVITEWDDYKDLGTRISSQQIIIDLRNIVSPIKYKNNYFTIGKNL
mgnify:CR=1 FL=1